MMTDVVPSPTSSSWVRLSSITDCKKPIKASIESKEFSSLVVSAKRFLRAKEMLNRQGESYATLPCCQEHHLADQCCLHPHSSQFRFFATSLQQTQKTWLLLLIQTRQLAGPNDCCTDEVTCLLVLGDTEKVSRELFQRRHFGRYCKPPKTLELNQSHNTTTNYNCCTKPVQTSSEGVV